jgi:hypothetical protein
MKLDANLLGILWLGALGGACGGKVNPASSDVVPMEGGGGSGSSGSSGNGRGSGTGSSGGNDASAVTPTGPMPGTGPIVCGMSTCMGPQEACCTGGQNGDTCMSRGTCPSGSDSYTCTSAANCPGQVCCLALGASPTGDDLAMCQNTCPSGGGGGGGPRRYQVCQMSSECSNGQTCRMSNNAAVTVCR